MSSLDKFELDITTGIFLPTETSCVNCPRRAMLDKAEKIVQLNPGNAFSKPMQAYKLSQLAVQIACAEKVAIGCPGADDNDCPSERERQMDELERLVLSPVSTAIDSLSLTRFNGFNNEQ